MRVINSKLSKWKEEEREQHDHTIWIKQYLHYFRMEQHNGVEGTERGEEGERRIQREMASVCCQSVKMPS